jgi:hypothetical protein
MKWRTNKEHKEKTGKDYYWIKVACSKTRMLAETDKSILVQFERRSVKKEIWLSKKLVRYMRRKDNQGRLKGKATVVMPRWYWAKLYKENWG